MKIPHFIFKHGCLRLKTKFLLSIVQIYYEPKVSGKGYIRQPASEQDIKPAMFTT